jgi:hypothetical protein
MNRVLILAAVAHVTLLVPSFASAQSRPVRREPAKADAPIQEVVDISDTFGVGTPAERWSLDDAIPVGAVDFDGKKVTLDARKVKTSTGADGERQLLYPVSWYEAYEGQNPDIKYVVVKYKHGKAFMIMVEYLPNRVSMPKASFQRHPDGQSYYCDLSTARQEGQAYFKQAISQGRDDGNGGFWVDTVVMYSTVDAAAPTKSNVARRP